VLYILAALGPFVADHMTELFGQSPVGRWYSPVLEWFDPNRLYQITLFGAAHGIAPDFVSVVLIRPGKEPEEVSSTNVCRQRAFLARVLNQVALAHAAVIAIDKSYGCSACPSDDPGTAALRTTIQEVARDVPVIVGLRTEDSNDLRQSDPTVADRLAKSGLDNNDEILLPALNFTIPGSSVNYGLIRIDKEIRRIPLGWRTYRDRSAVDRTLPPSGEISADCAPVIDPGHIMVATLSVAAARAFNSRRLNKPLRKMYDSVTHPYFSFFRDRDLDSLSVSSAIEVLCGIGSGARTDWTKCQTPLRGGFEDAFRNRVVFIGEQAEGDFWRPIDKTVPGVVLQASYTESLIEQKYLRPMAKGADVLASLAWLLIVECIFRYRKANPERALGWSLLSTAVLMLVFYRFLIVEAGIYFNLWPPSIAAILFRYLGAKVPEPAVATEPLQIAEGEVA
jgi:hypothetical protein